MAPSGTGWTSRSTWLKAALAALALIGFLRVLSAFLHPAYTGMTDMPCPAADPGVTKRVADLIRVIGGDQPAFDHWPGTCLYAEENARILREGRAVDVVFIGDSITTTGW